MRIAIANVRKSTVMLGRRSAWMALIKRRREATARLKEVLASLEGKDILISYCGESHSHWWFNDSSSVIAKPVLMQSQE